MTAIDFASAQSMAVIYLLQQFISKRPWLETGNRMSYRVSAVWP
jgi:hypothetical protein